MPDAASAKTTPAAYLPFKTFISSVEALEHGLPKKLDRSMWRQSGIIQGQIMMALRFFSLIDENDQPTPALQRLVDGKEKRAQQIAALLMHAYKSILDHDLTRTTPKMLEDLMGDYNVTGDTRRKAVAFFLRAAKFAEIPMHPLLLAQVRNTSGNRKRRIVPKKITSSDGVLVQEEELVSSKGSIKVIHLSNGGMVTLAISADPFTLPPGDRKFVFSLVDALQAYAEANPSSSDEDVEEEIP